MHLEKNNRISLEFIFERFDDVSILYYSFVV